MQWWEVLIAVVGALGALANIAVAVVAVVAAKYAKGQIEQARQQVSAAQGQLTAAREQAAQTETMRLEASQPYVAVDMRQLNSVGRTVELFVKNYGQTAAHNVRLESDPPLVSATGGFDADHPFRVFDVLPTLAPKQEWSTIWEGDAANRLQSQLPMVHDIAVTYEDSQGRQLVSNYRLDWEAHRWRTFQVTYGIHDLAKATRELLTEYKKNSGKVVVVQDKKEHDADEAAAHERWAELMQEMQARAKAADSAPAELPTVEATEDPSADA